MKKLFLLVLVSICGIAMVASAKDRPRVEIQIDDATMGRPDQVRSPAFVCEAWIDYQMHCIEVEIHASVGKVTVSIISMSGAIVSQTTLDTTFKSAATLSLPSKGMYTIDIKGAKYIGTGNFTIQ